MTSYRELLDDGRPDYHARLAGIARVRASAHLANTTYPSRGAAQSMRDLVNQLADAIEALRAPTASPAERPTLATDTPK